MQCQKVAEKLIWFHAHIERVHERCLNNNKIHIKAKRACYYKLLHNFLGWLFTFSLFLACAPWIPWCNVQDLKVCGQGIACFLLWRSKNPFSCNILLSQHNNLYGSHCSIHQCTPFLPSHSLLQCTWQDKNMILWGIWTHRKSVSNTQNATYFIMVAFICDSIISIYLIHSSRDFSIIR